MRPCACMNVYIHMHTTMDAGEPIKRRTHHAEGQVDILGQDAVHVLVHVLVLEWQEEACGRVGRCGGEGGCLYERCKCMGRAYMKYI